MSRRFTDSELFIIRNEIEIEDLIENSLSMPFERTNGRFRFACPICYCFDTGINKVENLAKCFTCNENFNTIDVAMRHMNLEFVPSVKFLQAYHKKIGDRKIIVENLHKTESRRSLTSISEIIPKLLPRPPESSSENQVSDHDHDDLSRRINGLEKKIDQVSLKLDGLFKMFVSKIIRN